MKNVIQKWIKAAIVISIAVFVFPLTNLNADQTESADSAGNINNILKSKKIEANIVSLNRTDGFTKGISLRGSSIRNIIIGFSNTVDADENFILISLDGNETIVRVASDGSADIIQGDAIDFSYIFCMLDAILTVIDGANACTSGDNICYAKVILSFITSVVNCGEPTTTTTI